MMKVVQAPRASAILYHLLCSQVEKHPWLLPANICPIVPITFLKARVPFELVDISPVTLHMDLGRAETLAATRAYGGLLYAHTYGEISTPHDFFAELNHKVPELLIVDDRCLCVPQLRGDLQSAAHVQLYSTGYAKMAELNFGGFAFLRDDVNYRHFPLLFDRQAHDAMEKSYKDAIHNRQRFIYRDNDWLETESELPGWQEYEDRIRSSLAAALEQRTRLNQTYTQLLPASIQMPESFQTWRFNVRLPNRDAVLAAIFAAGLFASSHYASLAGVFGPGEAPHAENLAAEVLNLFNDHHYSQIQVQQTCQIILENCS